ncbi:hypothetical protein A1O7_00372 [Cladophialophora yegresii CBS 114405]|uniref:Clr5 domain-containing protein n=1 Tax=Cladophialophora yegresii CBS 114405 TaxID=1182544 RepID=W9W7F8_9EURO|nr:uncharacterized protein A1O7_00372 [Cladophialophora yegresii CBS 114405]EXJ64037.1 hypothetical protein A1O7_00372 [Cladophialophora yegresii CBS 114405]
MDSGTDDQNEVMPHTGQQSALSWRTAAPTQQEWLSIKDVFTQLYIGENRRLKDVRAILSRRHGFDASEKMFKRRIAEWKIHKNYKAKEKELLAKRVKACVEAGHDVHSISFRGRPLKLDRVKRHYRSDKRFTRVWEQLSQSPDEICVEEAAVKEESPSSNTTISRTFLEPITSPECAKTHVHGNAGQDLAAVTVLPPRDFHNTEMILFHTREAVQWQFTAFTPLKSKELQARFPDMIPREVRTGQTDQVSAFWLGLYRGFDYFHTGRADDAWTTFDSCCNMVQPLIKSAPLQLLSCLLVHFATPWEGLAALEQQLLGFISSMAENSLGEHHPLVRALTMIKAANLRDRAIESMMQLVVEGYMAHRKSDNSSLFALRVDQIDALRRRRNFQHAHFLCQQLLRDSQTMRPKRYRTALAALGRLYAEQHEEFALEGVAHRILAHETSDSGSANSSTASWACDQLATLAMSRGDYGLAEQYLRRAASMSHAGLPHRGPSTDLLLNRLALCIHQQGKEVGAERIGNGFGSTNGCATS